MILSLAIVHNLLLFFCLVKYIYLIQYLMHQIYVFINYSIKNHEYLYVTVHFMFMLFTKNPLYPYSSDSAHTDPSYFVGFVII